MKKGKNIEEFGQLFGRGVKAQLKVQTLWVKVSQIDWDNKTMLGVGVADNLELYDIALGLGSFYRRPKVDSLCLVGIVENQEASAFLIDSEAFDFAVWTSGNSEFRIQEEGFVVRQENESLKEVLNDWQGEFGKLCDELNKVLVSVGTTPNIPVINKIKQEVTQSIKQRLNSILIE